VSARVPRRVGFNLLSQAERKAAARRGWEAQQAAGLTPKWTSETAKKAGALGGYRAGFTKRRMAKQARKAAWRARKDKADAKRAAAAREQA